MLFSQNYPSHPESSIYDPTELLSNNRIITNTKINFLSK